MSQWTRCERQQGGRPGLQRRLQRSWRSCVPAVAAHLGRDARQHPQQVAGRRGGPEGLPGGAAGDDGRGLDIVLAPAPARRVLRRLEALSGACRERHGGGDGAGSRWLLARTCLTCGIGEKLLRKAGAGVRLGRAARGDAPDAGAACFLWRAPTLPALGLDRDRDTVARGAWAPAEGRKGAVSATWCPGPLGRSDGAGSGTCAVGSIHGGLCLKAMRQSARPGGRVRNKHAQAASEIFTAQRSAAQQPARAQRCRGGAFVLPVRRHNDGQLGGFGEWADTAFPLRWRTKADRRG
jgi:hypothetical protein